MRELDLIRWLRESTRPSRRVLTGIGDDGAVLDWSGLGEVVVSTDLLLQGTHFDAATPPELVGRKALAVSISDLAAMGCRSRAALLAVGLPASRSGEYARRMLKGARALAVEMETALVGGDTTESRGPVTICSTVLGSPCPDRKPVGRGGARPGEFLLVTGALGGSRQGRHLSFVPRQREALALLDRFAPGAMIDLSDGLSTDARHLARESGVTLLLRADAVPASPAALDARDGRSPLEHALHDGEDFELLFTLPPHDAAVVEREGLAGTSVSILGEVRAGPAEVLIVNEQHIEERLEAGGYEHFR